MKTLKFGKCEHLGLSMFFLAAWHLSILLQLLPEAMSGKQLIALADCFELTFLLLLSGAGKWGGGGGTPRFAHNCISSTLPADIRFPGKVY